MYSYIKLDFMFSTCKILDTTCKHANIYVGVCIMKPKECEVIVIVTIT